MAGLDTIAGAPARIGRYFSVVSLIPSTLFASYLYLLVRSGAWSGPVNLSGAAEHLDFSGLAALGLISLLVALALHPLQFAIIQLFEGYWGTSRLVRPMLLGRALHHRNRLEALLRETGPESGQPSPSSVDLDQMLVTDEAMRLRLAYPEVERVLPTRLGNALRRYEDKAGTPYGLNVIGVTPRLGMIAGEKELSYVQNQRTQLDLAVRTTFLALVSSLLTLLFMWRHGLWMLLAIGPYTVGYLSYLGATVIAQEYGTALSVLLELNRFTLYERLHLKQPDTASEERLAGAVLSGTFDYDATAEVRYVHPARDEASAGDAPSEADAEAGAVGDDAAAQ